MRHGVLQRLIGVLGTIFALLALSAPVEAGYAQPSQANVLIGDFVGFASNFGSITSQYGSHLVEEVFAFAADFNQWNAQHGNLPGSIMTGSNGGQSVLFFFCCWLYELYNDSHHGTLSGSPSGNGAGESPIGSVLAGKPASTPVLSKGDDDSAGNENDQGSSSSLGSSGFPNGDLKGSVGNLPQLNPHPLGNASPSGDPAAVPAPAAFTLMATGALGLLLSWRKQRRAARPCSQV